MWKEFRDFITKGNLLQLAVAFIMGVAFATLIKSFIEDIIMPIVGKAAGNVDFANLYVNLLGRHTSLPMQLARQMPPQSTTVRSSTTSSTSSSSRLSSSFSSRPICGCRGQKRSDHRRQRIAPVAGRRSLPRQHAVPTAPRSSAPERIGWPVLIKRSFLALRATWRTFLTGDGRCVLPCGRHTCAPLPPRTGKVPTRLVARW